ncbi:hypothetical protein GUJ93_ZPchr0001g31257 [Zizania palustris]|uniref:Uncharacterized protein n=1 Tax=Zizania palustris TaxID=103762 RepID=A0A8J5V1B3_ZIZPA|nr:hypothetical protein GUJ93_ZPchr0001g31257 [Zizania palustris]
MAVGCSRQGSADHYSNSHRRQEPQGGGGTGGIMRKGPWTEQEDVKLVWFVRLLGERRWDFLAKVSGMQRTGKSCRLRWVNYLQPGLKRGRMSPEEERLVVQLHAKWGNRWSRIAKTMPGRTDNEIKNYWRTHMRKANKQQRQLSSSSSTTTHLQPAPSQDDEQVLCCMDQPLLPLWNDVDIDADCWSSSIVIVAPAPMPASPLWDVAYYSDSLWGSGHQDDDYINILAMPPDRSSFFNLVPSLLASSMHFASTMLYYY